MKKFLKKQQSKILITIYLFLAISSLYMASEIEASLVFEEMSYIKYRNASFQIKTIEIMNVGFFIAAILKILSNEGQARAEEFENQFKDVIITLLSKSSQVNELAFETVYLNQEKIEIMLEKILLEENNDSLKQESLYLEGEYKALKKEIEELQSLKN